MSAGREPGWGRAANAAGQNRTAGVKSSARFGTSVVELVRGQETNGQIDAAGRAHRGCAKVTQARRKASPLDRPLQARPLGLK